MKKITYYFSLLLMTLLVGLPAKAGGIASADELSNTAAYVIKSARGYMVYAPQYAADHAWCSNNTTGGATPIEVNEEDPNSQWAFITSAKGNSYLWSVGAKKFLYKQNPGTAFSDAPMGTDLHLLAATGKDKADFPWVVAFGPNQLNMSVNQNVSIFSNWNDTGDQGNMVEIRKVGDLSADVLAAANNAIAQYEQTMVTPVTSLEQLDPAKSYYVTNPRGDWSYDPAYTVNDVVLGTSMLVSSKVKGASAELAAANKQFAFVKSTKGNYYLYSVGAKKFVTVSANEGNTGTALADAPAQQLNFLNGTRGDKRYCWVLALDEKQIGVSNNYADFGGVITFWNDLADEGNNVMIVEGDAFDATELVKAVDAYEAITKITVDPVPGTCEKLPNHITLTFSNPVESIDYIMLSNEANNPWNRIPVETFEFNAEKTVLTVDIDPALLTSNYMGLMMEGTDVNGNSLTYGDWEDVISLEYNIPVPVNSYVMQSVNPEEGEVSELQKFVITLTNAYNPRDFVGGLDTSKEIVLKNVAGEVVAKGTASFDDVMYNGELTIELDKTITEAGKYTLVVPEGLAYNSMYNQYGIDNGIEDGAIYNPEIVLNYTVVISTGVESVEVANGEVEVYNLNGVLVAKSLSNLPKGVYVVNGKKVVVK